jgi:hypothetical protein
MTTSDLAHVTTSVHPSRNCKLGVEVRPTSYFLLGCIVIIPCTTVGLLILTIHRKGYLSDKNILVVFSSL